MKKSTSIILLALFIQSSVSSQSGVACLPDGITLTTQAQIDNFQVNYPGCYGIKGDVEINGDDITNLYGLNVVTSIGGSLKIGGNYDLLSLTGLGNLISIGGDLSIGYYITTWGGYIGNDNLINLIGLENLTTISGNLDIQSNANLTSLTGLDNLNSIGGSLTIMENPSLMSLSALANLNSGSISDLNIRDNISLSSCESQWICDYLSNPGGSVNIFNNAPGCDNPSEIASECGFTTPCLPYGNYYFFDQTDIDNFQANYPNCTELQNYVLIKGYNITDLAGLDNVNSIEGNLSIQNTALISFTGLEGLTSIGGYLNIGDNYNLTTLTGLDNIEASSITDLTIFWNPSLSACDVQSVCEYLASPNGNIHINYNAVGCYEYQIRGACESFCLPDGIVFTNQEEVDNFPVNFPGCNRIQGDLTISGVDIDNLDGLSALTYVGGDLVITGNDSLTSLSGLKNVNSIGSIMTIDGNAAITSIMDLRKIDPGTINEIHIVNNPSLYDCAIHSLCENLANQGATVQIFNNAPGCNNHGEVEEDCQSHCVYEGISFTSQAQVDNFQTEFPNCSQIEGDVKIGGNDINNLDGLSNITYIGGSLSIGYYAPGGINPVLNNLSGLINLTSIGGGLSIILNYVLSDLSGLDSLASINGDLEIRLNPSLSGITALSNINPASISNLIIYDNESLRTCEAESICIYLNNPFGEVNINSNGIGCNSQEEVNEACESVTVNEFNIQNSEFNIQIYPNPTSTQITIELPNAPLRNTYLTIYNIDSQQLLMQRITDRKSLLDISGLPAGLYFLKVSDERTVMVGKLLKK